MNNFMILVYIEYIYVDRWIILKENDNENKDRYIGDQQKSSHK